MFHILFFTEWLCSNNFATDPLVRDAHGMLSYDSSLATHNYCLMLEQHAQPQPRL